MPGDRTPDTDMDAAKVGTKEGGGGKEGKQPFLQFSLSLSLWRLSTAAMAQGGGVEQASGGGGGPWRDWTRWPEG